MGNKSFHTLVGSPQTRFKNHFLFHPSLAKRIRFEMLLVHIKRVDSLAVWYSHHCIFLALSCGNDDNVSATSITSFWSNFPLIVERNKKQLSDSRYLLKKMTHDCKRIKVPRLSPSSLKPQIIIIKDNKNATCGNTKFCCLGLKSFSVKRYHELMFIFDIKIPNL